MKKKKKRAGLFTKYYTVIALTVVFSLLVLGSIFSLFLYNYWKEKSFDDLQKNAAALVQAIEPDEGENYANIYNKSQSEYIKNILGVFELTDSNESYIVDPEGIVISSSEKAQQSGSRVVIPKNIMTLLMFKSPADQVSKQAEWGSSGKDVLIYAKPIYHGTEHLLSVVTVKRVSTFRPYIEDILRLFAFSAIGALVIAVAVTYYLVYRIYKPISQLKVATEKIGAGDYSFRVDIEGEDEFAHLGGAFNTMAQALSTLETSRRNFIANISHELKTPMTTIGGYIDAIMDGTISRDKQDHYLQIVSNEVKRLSRLVVAMLNLSKIEAGELRLEKKEVDISQLLFEVMVSFEQVIEKNEIEVVGLDKLKSIRATVDRDMIYQVFYNLVDNAVKFTDKGGYIAVKLEESDGKFIFRIINKCSGITKEDLSKIFERFYKVDRSRNLDVKGFGLGLYLAKTIVEMHGGQITARSAEGENCEFLFWVPLK